MYHIEDIKNKVIEGNSLEVLKKFPDNSVDTVITDPPYGLSDITENTIRDVLKHWIDGDESYIPQKKGFMNKDWDAFVPPPALWRELYRVVKPGATLLVFAGTRTQDLMSMSMRLAGFEIKDTLMWLYGQGFSKSLDVSKLIDKKLHADRKVVEYKSNKIGLANIGVAGYKDTWEVTEPATKEAKLWNGYRTHSLKPAYEPILMATKPNDGSYADNALKWEVAGLNIDNARIGVEKHIVRGGSGGQGTGWGKKNEINKEVQGRFPSNILLDEVSAKMLNCQDLAGISRFFYVAKVSPRERSENGVYNTHPTVKPLKLITYLVKLTLMPNPHQIYLDPFLGSGTTAVAVKMMGRSFVGIEQDPHYAEIARKRIASMDRTLFEEF